MRELVDQVLFQLQAAWRYRWFAVIIAWVIALAGWSVVYFLPDRYEANARVNVDTESVLKPLLHGLAVQPNLDQKVMMMSRTLISRPNLEKVVRMADLDVGLTSEEERAHLIAGLTKELAIKSAGRENLYTITYVDHNPEVAKRVVEALLTLFMEGSAVDKRKDSESARQFIDEQLKQYNSRLVTAEQAITEFRRRNLGLMPGGESRDYYVRLDAAKNDLNKAMLEMREAENSRDVMRSQLAAASDSTNVVEEKGDTDAATPEIDARIQALEQKLDGLRLLYTEQHPDIIAILPMIAKLRQQKEEAANARKLLPTPAPARVPANQQLTIALTTAEASVAAMRARVAEYSKRYAELQAVANAVPQVEAAYTQLTRDYEVEKARYEELLRRRESAQISTDMETNNAVMGFKVVDPPHVPVLPSAPNRPMLMTLVLLASLGGSIGIVLLMSQVRPTFYDERTLEEMSGLKVIGTVVMAWTDAQKSKRMRGLIALLASFAGLLSTYFALMMMLVFSVSRA